MKIESKSWQRFDGKLRNLKQYLQLMDLSLTISNKQCNKFKGEKLRINEILGAKKESHQQLNIPNQSKDINRTFKTARTILHEQAFIELHCLFSDYISNIIAEFSKGDPNRLLNDILSQEKDRNLKFSELVKLGSYDAVIKAMSQKIYRVLENLRSSTEMMNKLIAFTKIKIDEELIKKALIYIEVRHLIIHNNSLADEQFILRDQKKLIPLKKNKLSLNYDITNRATTTIFELCKKIDEEMINNGFLTIRTQL